MSDFDACVPVDDRDSLIVELRLRNQILEIENRTLRGHLNHALELSFSGPCGEFLVERHVPGGTCWIDGWPTGKGYIEEMVTGFGEDILSAIEHAEYLAAGV